MYINIQKMINSITIDQLNILIILLINTLSAQLFRFVYLFNRQSLIKKVENKEQSKNLITNYFLIAGFLNQPISAFNFLKVPKAHEAVFYLKYSQFGYSLSLYRRLLDKRIKREKKLSENADQMTQNIGISISLGDQILLDACGIDDSIAINPCPHGYCLKEHYRLLILLVSPFLSIIKLTLGWLSFLPCLKCNGHWYSIRLICDELSSLAHVSSRTSHYDRVDRSIILSQYDQFLDNRKVEKYFMGNKIEYLPCTHACTEDKRDSALYAKLIRQLLSF